MTARLMNPLARTTSLNLKEVQSDVTAIVNDFRGRVRFQMEPERDEFHIPFSYFHENKIPAEAFDSKLWLKDNHERFFKDSPNRFLNKEYYLSEMGFITSMMYTPDGLYVIVAHSTGLIQLRHGYTGAVLITLRQIQFPPKPIFALEFSKKDEQAFYAACTDGIVYRIDIPKVDIVKPGESDCIRADPALEWLNTQYYASAGTNNLSSVPFITQRTPVLALGITADSEKMIVGFTDTSIKIYNMETQEAEQIFKIPKLRLQFVPKKLRRVHIGQVCAVRCHNEKPYMFASAAWDKTLRIWDVRCKVGCVMTFEGLNVCHDSIDLNREQAVTGSWKTSEALCTWDLVAKKRLNIIRVQNRRPDVDGEYIYACRYWRSNTFNRKGKYAIIGGSGTGCVEVINLHNRYITASYPAPGTVLAVASFEDRIAYGGTAPVFTLVSFHDPKHEEYKPDVTPPYDFSLHPVTLFERYTTVESTHSVSTNRLFGQEIENEEDVYNKLSQHQAKSVCTDISKVAFRSSKIKKI